jgi:hypothetical protein
MREQTNVASKKALIVVPDWGLVWHIFCLEHAVELTRSGIEVSLLDLSNLNPKIFERRFWRLGLELGQKNRLKSIERKISKAYKINLINIKLPKRSSSIYDMTKERNDIFVSAMASKYSYITGRRQTHLEEIGSKIVEMERYFFDSTADLITLLQNQFKFDEIFTVNGRYVVDGAVVQACIESQVKCSLLESSGATPGLYEVYEISPHDIPSVQEMHKEFWEGAGSERDIIAERGLQKKLLGTDNPGFNFRMNFTKEFSETHDPTSQKLAAFFPSSDREFAIFPEFNWRNSFGGSQADAFLAFSRIAMTNGYRVVVRVHPVDGKSSRELQDHFAETEDAIWRQLCTVSKAEFIESRSQVSSYDLIKKADLCATYASSISIECILLEKPTLILGESEVAYCVPEICAFNEAELNAKFNQGIPIVSKEALYPYGYWLESAGRKPKLFKFVSDHEVYFEERRVNEYKQWAKYLHTLKKRIETVMRKSPLVKSQEKTR